jgi:hypothetical protein
LINEGHAKEYYGGKRWENYLNPKKSSFKQK